MARELRRKSCIDSTFKQSDSDDLSSNIQKQIDYAEKHYTTQKLGMQNQLDICKKQIVSSMINSNKIIPLAPINEVGEDKPNGL